MKKINSKFILIMGVVLVSIIALIFGGIKLINNRVKITPTAVQILQYETFDNGLISIRIPKGWKVQVIGDYIHYTFKVYNPENPLYQIFSSLKFEGFNKSEASKNLWKKLYGSSNIFAQSPVIAPQTAEAFYKIYPDIAVANNNSTFTFPEIYSFTVVENLGSSIFGGDILRATFLNADNKVGEGLFTATVKDVGTYYALGVDTYPLFVYNAMGYTTPEGEFIDWESVLNECLSSLEFSDKFMQGFNAEQEQVLSTVMANSKIYNEISDTIMSSWNNRQKTYDTISQKRSDATLGYQRVYDKETNETYKAEVGWYDSYKGKRYELVTDDEMYSKKISGYIYK